MRFVTSCGSFQRFIVQQTITRQQKQFKCTKNKQQLISAGLEASIRAQVPIRSTKNKQPLSSAMKQQEQATANRCNGEQNS